MIRKLLTALLLGSLCVLSAAASGAEAEPGSACEAWVTQSVVSPQGEVAYDRLPFEVLYHYRQKNPALVDPLGDYALVTQGAFTPQAILWALRGERETRKAFDKRILEAEPCALEFFRLPSTPAPVAEPRNPALFEKQTEIDQIHALRVPDAVKTRMLQDYRSGRLDLEGHWNPIRRTPFARMILQIIADERRDRGIRFFEGRHHHWSDEFKRKHAQRFFPFTVSNKLLMALARGDTAKFMVTGTESRLEQWALEQPYRSLTPDQVIRKSYVLNNGNFYLTLLTIENVFARHWRNLERDRLPLTLRLKPIINHFGANNDDFGSWYHFFGIMLYGYVYGEYSAVSVASTESLGSHILARFQDEAQEDWINDMGGRVGQLVRALTASGEQDRLKPDANALRPETYLNLGESFESRLYDYARMLESGR